LQGAVTNVTAPFCIVDHVLILLLKNFPRIIPCRMA